MDRRLNKTKNLSTRLNKTKRKGLSRYGGLGTSRSKFGQTGTLYGGNLKTTNYGGRKTFLNSTNNVFLNIKP